MFFRTKFLLSTSRSVYASRLRKAFLLRTHPDRFRAQSAKIRKDQANVVQALSDRMAEADFLSFTASSSSFLQTSPPSNSYQSYNFFVELKNGELKANSIQLNSSPQKILEQMAYSIGFAPPPLSSKIELQNNGKEGKYYSNSNTMYQNDGYATTNSVDHLIRTAGWGGAHASKRRHQQNLDRNLLHFLQNMDPNDIKERKLNRIGASAAALVARRAFQFSAIDGTGLGWSSESLKICLARLTSLYDEHQSKLRTESFYPFRLVLSSDEFNREVDLYAGVIQLNPAATSLQWLDTLMTVTDESKQRLKQNRDVLKQNLSQLENALGIKVVKGYSCGSEEYHHCLERLANEQSTINAQHEHGSSLSVTSKASLIIETEQACRRGKLRKDGNFEVGAGMRMDHIRSTLSRFASRSNEILTEQSKMQDESKKHADRVMYEFGLQRVYKVSTAPMISYAEMTQALVYLLEKDDEEKQSIRSLVVGQTVGVTGRGQTCHIADDGSIVLPFNFT